MKKVFLEISQNCEISKDTFFYRTPQVAAFVRKNMKVLAELLKKAMLCSQQKRTYPLWKATLLGRVLVPVS